MAASPSGLGLREFFCVSCARDRFVIFAAIQTVVFRFVVVVSAGLFDGHFVEF